MTNIFKKLFNKNKEIQIKESNDSFIKCMKIYQNGYNNLIVLFSYTENYLDQAIEFIDACNRSQIITQNIKASWSEDTDQTDTRGDTIKVIHKFYYLLIGGTIFYYLNIFRDIDEIGNDLLDALINNVIYHYFPNNYITTDLIKNGYLDKRKFTSNDTEHTITFPLLKNDLDVEYDNLPAIKQILPEEFETHMLLPFIQLSRKSDNYVDIPRISYQDALNLQNTSSRIKDAFTSEGIELFAPYITINNIKEYYKFRCEIDRDLENDGLDAREIDDMFKQELDRISPLIDGENFNDYTDINIDEIIADDEG